MNRRTLFAALAVAGTGLLGACGPSSPPPSAAAAAAAPAAATGSCDTRFTVQNRSSNTVSEFYFRPAGSSEWGPDRFGQRHLTRGLTVGYRATGDGRYDLRIVWQSGRESRLDNVNLCEHPLIVADADRLFAPSASAQPAAARPRGAARQ